LRLGGGAEHSCGDWSGLGLFTLGPMRGLKSLEDQIVVLHRITQVNSHFNHVRRLSGEIFDTEAIILRYMVKNGLAYKTKRYSSLMFPPKLHLRIWNFSSWLFLYLRWQSQK
jgi:hypothetical protein